MSNNRQGYSIRGFRPSEYPDEVAVEKPCDFEGCLNFARRGSGKFCHAHQEQLRLYGVQKPLRSYRKLCSIR